MAVRPEDLAHRAAQTAAMLIVDVLAGAVRVVVSMTVAVTAHALLTPLR